MVFDTPPIDIFTYATWSVPDRSAVRQEPYFWDRACPPRLTAGLRRVQQAAPGGRAGEGRGEPEL